MPLAPYFTKNPDTACNLRALCTRILIVVERNALRHQESMRQSYALNAYTPACYAFFDVFFPESAST